MKVAIIIAALAVAVLGLASCATTGPGPFAKCNPVMDRCNEADLPPLTAQLPPWPFARLQMPIEYADAFANAERKKP